MSAWKNDAVPRECRIDPIGEGVSMRVQEKAREWTSVMVDDWDGSSPLT